MSKMLPFYIRDFQLIGSLGHYFTALNKKLSNKQIYPIEKC